MASRRDETSAARAEHLSRTSAIPLSSFLSKRISRLSSRLVQERQMNGSSLLESSLYRYGGILAQPLWNQRPHFPSHSSASSLPSTIAPWQTPQGTLPRRGGFPLHWRGSTSGHSHISFFLSHQIAIARGHAQVFVGVVTYIGAYYLSTYSYKRMRLLTRFYGNFYWTGPLLMKSSNAAAASGVQSIYWSQSSLESSCVCIQSLKDGLLVRPTNNGNISSYITVALV